MMYETDILGLVQAKNKTEVARKIKSFCLAISEQTLEQIEREQIIREINP